MAEIAGAFSDLSYLDYLSTKESRIHRLDPRAKLLVVMVFIACVVSFQRHSVSALIPYFFFPAVMIALAGIPLRYLLKKYLFLLPFAVLIGVFNPIFDHTPLLTIGPITISGGWVSFTSIIIRFTLTVLAAFILIAVTGFNGVCAALERFHVPKIFSVQLMMLYRYIFVLSGEAMRMVRARDMRSVGKKGTEINVYGSLVGHLLLRTWDRAQRVHMAMLSRGFNGEFYVKRPLVLKASDVAFTALWCSLFILFRFINLPVMVGHLILGAN